MTVEDYHKQGVSTVISYDTTDWFYDYFLMLDDQTDSPGSWSWCGETCTRHTLEVTSDVDQDVYVTAQTWESRTQPTECRKENKIHSIYRDGDFRVAMFKDGAYQIDPISFKAGQTINFIVEWDWERENVTPDWSITAWAEQGTVKVTHVDGLTSDKLPLITPRDEAAKEEQKSSEAPAASEKSSSEAATAATEETPAPE